MKGRSNYACLYRIAKSRKPADFRRFGRNGLFREVRHWSRESETGDRAELVNLPENLSFWSRINAKSKLVSDKNARFRAVFYHRMRAAPKKPTSSSSIIIFFRRFEHSRQRIRARFARLRRVIFDEAHLIEDIAADYFGFQVSSFQMDELVRDADAADYRRRCDARFDETRRQNHRSCRSISGRVSCRFAGRTDAFRSPMLSRRKITGEIQPTPLGEAYFALDSRSKDWKRG
jgi:Rad3-related DNA helicase